MSRGLLLFVFSVFLRDVDAAEPKPLSAAVIRGSTLYSPADFYNVYRAKLGQRADAMSARAVMADIESMYARGGYLRPRIQVWDDLLADGILRIDLHEVLLADVVIKGDAGPYSKKVSDATRALMTELPLRANSVPAALEALRALPGLDLEASVVEQTGVDGGLVLNIVTSYRPLNASVQGSNRGTNEVGPDLFSAQLVENNLLHANERIGAFVTAARQTSEYHAVGGFIELPLDRGATVMALSGVHSNSQPSIGGTQYDLFHPQDTLSLMFTHWFVRRDRFRLAVGLGAEYQDSEITFEGVELETDRLRTGQLNLHMEGQSGEKGAYAVSMGWRRGLSAFNSRIDFLDGGSLDPAYDIGSLDVAYAAPIGSHWRWRAEFLGQSSSQQLPYVEQFKVGGIQLGRGLATAMLAGDSGAGGKLELTYFFGGAPRWLGNPSLFSYTDYGTVRQRGIDGREYIGTAGVGLQSRFSWGRLAAEVGRPVTFSGGRPADTQVFGEVQVRF